MNFAEIWDTPGYFYGFSYALSASVVIQALLAGRVKWRDWLSQAALTVFLVTLAVLTKGAQNLAFVAAMFTVVAAIYLSVLQTLREPVKAGFYALNAFMFAEFAASTCWLIYYHLALRFEVLQGWQGQAAAIVGVYGAFFAGFFLSQRALLRHEVDLPIDRRELAITALMVLSVYVVSNLGYIDRNSPLSGSNARDVFAIRTLVDLCGATLIYAFHSQLIEVQVRFEKDTLHGIMEAQYQAYQLSRESIDMVNQKYHDLKHQIALMRAQADSGRTEAYLRQMERDIQAYEAQNQTGNPVLDVVLTNKALYCQKHDIELKFIVDGKLLDFMEDMDLSALFGNMLDNAIESVERLADRQKRLIRLYVSGENHFLRIRIENYCEERLRFRDGMPVTTKRDVRYHGFGMKSMQRTVAKYGGSMMASQKDNWFILSILIPMKPR